jgi:translation elongation factor EF-Ts
MHPPHAPAVCPPCRPKIVDGRVAKIAKEMALLEQPFVKDTDKTVAGGWLQHAALLHLVHSASLQAVS